MDTSYVAGTSASLSAFSHTLGGDGKAGVFKRFSVETATGTSPVGAGDGLDKPTVLLSSRIAEGLPSNPLCLDNDSDHARAFNEVVRRIKPTQQSTILDKLQDVSEEQVQKLVECCDHPSLLTGNYLDFLVSNEFPYVALRAFRDERISLNEFSTLVSLQGIYMESGQKNNSFKLTYQKLFDESGTPIEKGWEKIEDTLLHCRQRFLFDVKGTIATMQEYLKTARLLEAGFWYYDIVDVSIEDTIADAIRYDIGLFALSRIGMKEMIPSLTLRQTYLDSIYGKEAHRISPVIGISSVADVRIGGEARRRDFAVPFPDHPLPHKADGYPSETISDFQHHDFYHAVKCSQLANKYIDLYLEVGDALDKQKQKYTEVIDGLKALRMKRFQSFEKYLKEHKETISQEREQQAKDVFCRDGLRVERLINYLKFARKGTGEMKFRLYDMDWAVNPDDVQGHLLFSGRHKVFNAHVVNIIDCMNSDAGRKTFLKGVPAELAGRSALAKLADGIKFPRTRYTEHLQTIEKDKQCYVARGLLQEKPENWHWQQYQRSKRFIACLNDSRFFPDARASLANDGSPARSLSSGKAYSGE